MYPYTYKLSLRIRHPEFDPQLFSDTLGRQPKRAWRVGERRTTPKGDLLEGHHDSSYWTSPLTPPDDSDLPSFIRRTVEDLKPHDSFFRHIRDTGGSVECFIGLFADSVNIGVTLTYDLMAALGSLGIDLALDIYDYKVEEIPSP
jgi:hypothetical protein